MLDDLDQTQVLGLAVVVAAGMAFAGGYALADGGAGDTVTPTGDVVAADTVEDDVLDYLETMTQGQADITVDGVEEAEIGELYRVDVSVSAEDPMSGETMDQQASVYATLDAEYVFPAEPDDLQNPEVPQMQMQQEPPEGQEMPDPEELEEQMEEQME